MSETKKRSLPMIGEIDRRTVVKAGAATLGLAAWATAIQPMFEWAGDLNADDFLQKHYRELNPNQLQTILNRLTDEARKESGKAVTVKDHKPLPGVSFAYALNLSICIGCRRCAEACHVENNHDRPSHQSYIRVFEMQKGGIDFEKGDATYDHPVPAKDKYYMPVQCQQCENAPCVKACPIEATWQEADGIVVVDYNWCIGCRYCEAACPVPCSPVQLGETAGARRRSKSEPKLPLESHSPARGDGEMYILPAPYPRGSTSGVSGSVPDRGTGVRQCARPGQ